MKIFNYNPNLHNQNNVKKTSVPVVQTQADRIVQSENHNFATNVYFHPAQISFGALKKHEFEGIDFAVVEKFKAPIEKFKTNDDLQNWAKEQTETITNKDFGGRQKETKVQRKAMLKEWADYVLKENDAYNNATALLILNAITKDLKPDNDKIPPVLNKGVLADCISEIDKNIKADKKYQFDLNKMYETKLRALYFEDTKIEGGNTGWVVIPSKQNDPENFETNVEKLKTLSHKNWCTKSFNAEPYLFQGDFHVYLENGQPKLGVRFVGDAIQEIQGEKNNGKIPVSYFDEVQKHIKDENLKLRSKAKQEILITKEAIKDIEEIKKEIKPLIDNKDVKAIFECCGIDVEEDKDGFWTISEYKQPSDSFSFSDIGIDENMLLEKVKEISGNANFENSKITNLGNIKRIGKAAVFTHSQVKSLGNLESIGGFADFINSQVTDLGKLKKIGVRAYFSNSPIKSLGNLESIGGSAFFESSQITDFGNLKTIGGNAYFGDSSIKSLGNLEMIGKNANFSESEVTDLGNLKFVGGDVYFEHSQVTDLGNLESIGGDAYFEKSKVTNLGNLKTIGDDADFRLSQITDLANLETIGRNAYFQNSKVKSLGNLETIGRNAYFQNSKVKSLGNLETIGGKAFFDNSQVTDFGKLKYVNGEKFLKDDCGNDKAVNCTKETFWSKILSWFDSKKA